MGWVGLGWVGKVDRSTEGLQRELLSGNLLLPFLTCDAVSCLATQSIAEEAGACAVMALERVPADIRAKGGVARMADPKVIRGGMFVSCRVVSCRVVSCIFWMIVCVRLIVIDSRNQERCHHTSDGFLLFTIRHDRNLSTMWSR